MYKSLFLDFEFSEVVERNVRLVCCSTRDEDRGINENFWLHFHTENQSRLTNYLNNYDTFLCYSAVAECRSFIALGLNPLDYGWIDLFLEYRCLTNHNDELQWGEQLVDGRVRVVQKPRPKWERESEGGDSPVGFRATHSLAEASYKLLKVTRDTDHKKKMRDLIISNPHFFTEEEQKAIMDYCLEDVLDLPKMFEVIVKIYLAKDPDLTREQLIKEMKIRGRYAAHTAWMETRGYPIDVEKTRNFSKQVGNILFDLQKEINGLFPDIKPFRWNKADGRFSWNQAATREWIKSGPYIDKWTLTKGGASGKKDLSLALDAFTKFYDFKHSYPKDNFGAQMVRFLKMKQTIYGFTPSPDPEKKNFWSSVGKDGRVRPYLNIYGSQSSRSQPASTGFMFLKPAWMRALVAPAPGRFMAGIDYGSQEFFISALLSRDQNMIDAYLSGDVYLAFGKLAGLIPPDGTKATHPEMRNLCKSTVLGISYLMSQYGLAIKLTQDSGKPWSEDDAQGMIDNFYSAFSELSDFQEEAVQDYADKGFIKLPCGWYMWGDNENFRSVTNCPVQGFGASVMRKAVDLAYEYGVTDISFTLHDAIYIEGDVGDEGKIELLHKAMKEAFAFYFPEELKETARKIVLDPFAWSPDYKKDSSMIVGDSWLEVPCSNLYIDDRSATDYEAFSKYFDSREEDEL